MRYRDAGFDCEHEVCAESEEELMRQVAEQAHVVHNVDVSPELVEHVKGPVRDAE